MKALPAAALCAAVLLSHWCSVDAFLPQNSWRAHVPKAAAVQRLGHRSILTSTAADDSSMDLVECDEDEVMLDPTVVDAAVLDAAVEEPLPTQLLPGAARHMIPISVALTIAVFSILEIAESVKELAERRAAVEARVKAALEERAKAEAESANNKES